MSRSSFTRSGKLSELDVRIFFKQEYVRTKPGGASFACFVSKALGGV